MTHNICSKEYKGEKYIFYDYIDEYKKYENFCSNDGKCDKYRNKCDFSGSYDEGNEVALSNICVKFKYLIDNILNIPPSKRDNKKMAHLAFLNYWLNNQIYKNEANICPKQFYQKMRAKDFYNRSFPILKEEIYYIDEEDIANMNKLFHLYVEYNEIKNLLEFSDTVESFVMQIARHCVSKYKELEVSCGKTRTDVCNTLKTFKEKFERTDLKLNIHEDWINKTLPSLSNDADDEPHDNEVVVHPMPSSVNYLEPLVKPIGNSEESTELATVAIGTSTETEVKTIRNGTDQLTQSESSEKDSSQLVTASLSLTGKTPDETNDNITSDNENKESNFVFDTKKIIGSVISSLGISLIFFMFYKFTSLGSRLFRRGREKKKIRYNLNEQGENYLDTSQYEQIHTDMNSYNIVYNSA
ncbi:PIR protein [Plasmodium vivax]|uniref:VIR protein n=1 Tax=Plasmodium vivax TaxID=5855 RepID=A0A564ZMY9_PLAVI|nr:PIR protein [Plasmodium vivax]